MQLGELGISWFGSRSWRPYVSWVRVALYRSWLRIIAVLGPENEPIQPWSPEATIYTAENMAGPERRRIFVQCFEPVCSSTRLTESMT